MTIAPRSKRGKNAASGSTNPESSEKDDTGASTESESRLDVEKPSSSGPDNEASSSNKPPTGGDQIPQGASPSETLGRKGMGGENNPSNDGTARPRDTGENDKHGSSNPKARNTAELCKKLASIVPALHARLNKIEQVVVDLPDLRASIDSIIQETEEFYQQEENPEGPKDKGKGREAPLIPNPLTNKEAGPVERPLDQVINLIDGPEEGANPSSGEFPSALDAAVQRSRATVNDLHSPDMNQLRDDIVAFVRPRIKSDADGTTTISGTHESMEREAEYWDNQCNKAFMRARRARELNATSYEKLLVELVTEGADSAVVNHTAKLAREAKMNLERMTRLKEANLTPHVTPFARVYKDTPQEYEEGVRIVPPPVLREETPPRPRDRYDTPQWFATPGVGETQPLENGYEGIVRFMQRALQNNVNRPEKTPFSHSGLKLHLPEAYQGSSDLEAFETFIGKLISWLELMNVLWPGLEHEQLLLVENYLKGDTVTWYFDHV